MKNRLYIVIIAIFALFTLQSCGVKVKYSFTGASIPVAAKTYSVDYFPNRALLIVPSLSTTLTEKLRTYIQDNTSLIEVTDGSGDLRKTVVESIQIPSVRSREVGLEEIVQFTAIHVFQFDHFHGLFLSVQQGEALVMVVGVVDQTVIGEDQTLGTSRLGAQSVDITFGILPICGKQFLVIAEVVTADALAGGVGLQRTTLPA